MADERERANKPEDITRLFVERANAKDARDWRRCTSRTWSSPSRPGR